MNQAGVRGAGDRPSLFSSYDPFSCWSGYDTIVRFGGEGGGVDRPGPAGGAVLALKNLTFT